jgi:hypothetical protein
MAAHHINRISLYGGSFTNPVIAAAVDIRTQSTAQVAVRIAIA